MTCPINAYNEAKILSRLAYMAESCDMPADCIIAMHKASGLQPPVIIDYISVVIWIIGCSERTEGVRC